jgi:hypothetical protein
VFDVNKLDLYEDIFFEGQEVEVPEPLVIW